MLAPTTYNHAYHAEGVTTVIAHYCFMCNRHHTYVLDMKFEHFRNRMNSGALIDERLFPEFSDFERDVLITGLCREHWDELYAPIENGAGEILEDDEIPF